MMDASHRSEEMVVWLSLRRQLVLITLERISPSKSYWKILIQISILKMLTVHRLLPSTANMTTKNYSSHLSLVSLNTSIRLRTIDTTKMAHLEQNLDLIRLKGS